MRAHSQSVDLPFPAKDREPWMQTSRVREAIRNAINQRYDLIHYLYTTFETATRTAEPIMRPMWSEFPDESRFRDVESQFMFGSSLLVAPKVIKPEGVYEHMHLQQVIYALPLSESWYNYYTKALQTSTPEGEWVDEAFADLDQAVFVRGGSILPVLQHEDCMSLLPCMRNNITLEVYPVGSGDLEAYGDLYLDDGSSFNYTDQEAKSARLTY